MNLHKAAANSIGDAGLTGPRIISIQGRKHEDRERWFQRVGMSGLGSRLSTYGPIKRSKWRCNQHTSADQTPIPCVQSRHMDSNRKGGCVCEERTLRRSQTGQAQLGLSCKATKCSDAGTVDLGVLTTHETSSREKSEPGF